jgi:hypothetical protein
MIYQQHIKNHELGQFRNLRHGIIGCPRKRLSGVQEIIRLGILPLSELALVQ